MSFQRASNLGSNLLDVLCYEHFQNEHLKIKFAHRVLLITSNRKTYLTLSACLYKKKDTVNFLSLLYDQAKNIYKILPFENPVQLNPTVFFKS